MKWTLLFPLWMTLDTIFSLGESRQAYTISSQMVVTAFIISFGLWLLGYMEGKKDSQGCLLPVEKIHEKNKNNI